MFMLKNHIKLLSYKLQVKFTINKVNFSLFLISGYSHMRISTMRLLKPNDIIKKKLKKGDYFLSCVNSLKITSASPIGIPNVSASSFAEILIF